MSAPPIVKRVVEQHAAEAAFLWTLRDAATDESHYTLRHLAALEERLDAHLDALLIAGTAGREIAWARLERVRGATELFPVATIALESRTETEIERMLQLAETVPESRRGLFGALGWVSPKTLRSHAANWLDSRSPFRRLAGVVACSLQRVDPGPRFEGLLNDEPLVRARALRLAGELGKIALRQQIVSATSDEDEACRFWAAWAAGLLAARPPAISVLTPYATGDGRFKWPALQLLVRLMSREAAIAWLRDLGRDPSNGRLLVVATGILGDPIVVPWLIEKMTVPPLARVAGESFSMITGEDLFEHGPDAQAPEGFITGPADDRTDENLPWPDHVKVQAWWQKEQPRFAPGIRHVGGLPIAEEACKKVLRDGRQRQRRAAAYELALISPGHHLWNWRAKSYVQASWLGAPTQT